MQKRWVYKEVPTEDQVSDLAASLGVSKEVAVLLLQRNIFDFEEAKRYFRPSLGNLYDPFRMKDMDKAVHRLLGAMANNEKILVYGDYDVDGTTAVSLFFGFLSRHYFNMDYYIPDRYAEGYGVSSQGIQYAHENGFSLIISLDCGIKAVEKVKEAKNLGIDFIICDHHRPGDILPPAVAVLDPKRSDCTYPFKELSGCGVGFKLLQGFCQFQGLPQDELYEYLDLLVVSIASDIVPISDENRILAYFGLEQLSNNPRPGLRALLDISGIKGELDITKIVFGIGPRINAAGRIKHARAAVDLLLSEDEDMARELAGMVNKTNDERRNFDATITREALEMIQNNEAILHSKTTVLFKNDWHKGVIGIVASRCIEKYYRPTVILTESNQKATGSVRSVPGFDVYEAIEECADLLEQFGGHQYAAGLTLSLDKVEAFREKFEMVVARKITAEILTPLVNIDLEIPLWRINTNYQGIIKQMAPFGPGNMQPVFATHRVKAVGQVRILKEEHLKFSVADPQTGREITCIGFGMAEYAGLVESGMEFSIAYTIEENEFRGVKTLQAQLKDLKFD